MENNFKKSLVAFASEIIKTKIQKDFKYEFGSTWEISGDTVLIKQDEVENLTIRDLTAKILNLCAVSMHSDNFKGFKPELSEKTEGKLRAFALLFNELNNIRSENLMSQWFPGTFLNFYFSFKKTESQISGQAEQKLAGHVQFIKAIHKDVYQEDNSFYDPEIIEEIKPLKGCIEELIETDDVNVFMDNLLEKIWPVYKKFIPPDAQKNANESALDKAQKGIDMSVINNELKKLSKNAKKDFKKVFGEDVEKEFDIKENKITTEGESRTEKQGEESLQKSLIIREGHENLTGKGEFLEFSSDPEILLALNEVFQRIQNKIGFFYRKFNSILKDNNQSRQGGNFRSGKLNNKKLYRYKCRNTKLFTKKIDRKNKDYSISLLVDISGSMSGEKVKQAMYSAYLISEILHKLKINFEIIGFNLCHFDYKKFSDSYGNKTRKELLKLQYGPSSKGGGGNNDAYEVHEAVQRLKKYPDSKKIMIVLSDGCPAPDANFEHLNLKKEIQMAEKNGIIVFGVGILSTHVFDFYDKCIKIDAVEELPSNLLNILKKFIKRG